MKYKSKEIAVTIDYEITVNKRYQIGKRQMNNIIKKTLFDLIKKNRGYDLDVFINDANNHCFCFCVSYGKRFIYPYSNYDFWVTCCYTDYELLEMGYITDSFLCDTTEFTNNLFIDYENNQHRKLDYLYSEYEFNRF